YFLSAVPPPRSTRFPYPTLFRSTSPTAGRARRARPRVGLETITSESRRDLLRFGVDQLAPVAKTSQRVAAASTSRVTPELQSASDRKSTRLNSSHQIISYAVLCL